LLLLFQLSIYMSEYFCIKEDERIKGSACCVRPSVANTIL